jgi:hypothetical protein
MQLCAVVTKDDLAGLIDEITPLGIELARRPKRVVSLGRPSLVELVAGAGLRIRGAAKLTWDVAGLPIPVTIRRWQIMLVPSIVVQSDAHVLAFDPVLEALDLENVPAFVDDRLAGAINEGLAAQRRRLAWNFSRTLSVRRPLSAKILPPTRFELVPSGGVVTITSSELRLSVSFRAEAPRAPSEAEAPPSSQRGSPSSRSARA